MQQHRLSNGRTASLYINAETGSSATTPFAPPTTAPCHQHRHRVGEKKTDGEGKKGKERAERGERGPDLGVGPA